MNGVQDVGTQVCDGAEVIETSSSLKGDEELVVFHGHEVGVATTKSHQACLDALEKELEEGTTWSVCET